MMKKLLLFAMCVVAVSIAYAQDVIVLKNANEIEAKVSAISPENVTYKRWNNLDGPVYTIPKSEVFYIKYQNGDKEVIQEKSSVSEVKVSPSQQTRINAIKQARTKKATTPSTIRYKGEVNLGYAIADKKPDIFMESFLTSEYNGEPGHGYYCATTDTLRSSLSRPLFETTHGIEIGNYFFVGAGLGLQFINGKLQDLSSLANHIDEKNKYRWNALLLPIFANFKIMYPIKDTITPFLNLSVGGTIACSSALNFRNYEVLERFSSMAIESDKEVLRKMRGGFYCDFGAGVRYKMLNLAIGLLHQTMKLNSEFLYQRFNSSGKRNSMEYYKEFTTQKYTSFYMKVGVNF